MKQPSLREEIAGLRAEIEQLRDKAPAREASAGDTSAEAGGSGHDRTDDIHTLLGELGDLVQTMLDEAEESVAEHPVVSAALALGIVIGRLTAK